MITRDDLKPGNSWTSEELDLLRIAAEEWADAVRTRWAQQKKMDRASHERMGIAEQNLYELILKVQGISVGSSPFTSKIRAKPKG